MLNAKIKRMIVLIVLVIMAVGLYFVFGTRNVKINERHFPDKQFREFLMSTPEGTDGVLSSEELEKMKELDVSRMKISDLTGIRYFDYLEVLDCSSNEITELDLRHNRRLKELDCSSNDDLNSLNVSKTRTLLKLDCSYCELKELDLTQNIALMELNCSWNKLKKLDITKNKLLEEFKWDHNSLSDVDTSNNPKLSVKNNSNTTLNGGSAASGSTSKSSVKANTWYISGSLIMVKNCEVRSAVPTGGAGVVMITFFPVCQSCHVASERLEMDGVAPNIPMLMTYSCKQCNSITYVQAERYN